MDLQIPERQTNSDLTHKLTTITQDKVFTTLLSQVNGIVAILNTSRQLVAINTTFLEYLGIDSSDDVFGLRLGEALDCSNYKHGPDGCGTSKYCESCGAAIAMVSCQNKGSPQERYCVIRRNDNTDVFLKIQASPMELVEDKYLLILAQDMTREQYRGNLERIFFHDIGNIIQALSMRCRSIKRKDSSEAKEVIDDLTRISRRLNSEFLMLKKLRSDNWNGFESTPRKIDIEELLIELQTQYTGHPSAANKWMEIERNFEVKEFVSDYSLILRIVGNMLINAFEASIANEVIKLIVTEENSTLTFSVWNPKTIPEHIQPRIFQKNFTTKNEAGHGLGCYSMQLFGESCLGGKVSFSSNREEGTTFSIALPLN